MLTARLRPTKPVAYSAIIKCLIVITLFQLAACGGKTDSATASTSETLQQSKKLALSVADVRPEAFSWLWNNQTLAILQHANPAIESFQWVFEPDNPHDLGYEANTEYKITAKIDGTLHDISVRYNPPASVSERVDSINFLGHRPFSFLAMSVYIDQEPAIDVLIQYTAAGERYLNSNFEIELTSEGSAEVVESYANFLSDTLKGTSSFLSAQFDDDYLMKELLPRGEYEVTPVDLSTGIFKVIAVQDIKYISPDMLAWWWDHINNLERYRLWQPIDHDAFHYEVVPSNPDLQYDIGATQIIREYIGASLMTLSIAGADPDVVVPPTALTEPRPYYFYSLNGIEGIQEFNGIVNPLPSVVSIIPTSQNQLVHQWKPSESGEGVTLHSTFTLSAAVLAIQPTFGDDLGRHVMREFQMMPYFLPRLYRREWMGE